MTDKGAEVAAWLWCIQICAAAALFAFDFAYALPSLVWQIAFATAVVMPFIHRWLDRRGYFSG